MTQFSYLTNDPPCRSDGVYSERMAEARHGRTIVGLVGVLCLAIFWTARFAPEIADAYFLSTFGKLFLVGSLLAGILLTAIASIRGSKWWLVAAAAGAITLVDLYIRSRIVR